LAPGTPGVAWRTWLRTTLRFFLLALAAADPGAPGLFGVISVLLFFF
jgi:hypothetical protein